MTNLSPAFNIIIILDWLLMLVFATLGVLNWLQVHEVPGIFYLLVMLLYCPPLLAMVQKRLVWQPPYVFRMVFAFVLLWATLAVGDLAEIYGL